MTVPLSVAMPVHDALPWLDEAVTSILAQSFAEFEFVIFDDGSTDGSLDRLRYWAGRDSRIRIVEGGVRRGPVASSNAAVAATRAPLVARMDADDLAHPDRFQRQIDLMRAEPDIVLAGTLADVVDRHGRRVLGPDLGRVLRPSPFAPFGHSSILFRREAFERAGCYRAEAERWEDVDLYLRMAGEGRIAVLLEPLMTYRYSGDTSRIRAGEERFEESMDRMHRSLSEWERSGTLAAAPAERIAPQAFVTCGSTRLWAGQRPAVLRRLLRRGDLRADGATVAALIWASWGAISPSSLRFFLRAMLRTRNRRARVRLAGREWIEWRPRPRTGPSGQG